MLSSYDQVKVDGVCRNALIIRVEERGLLVRFGGDVTGWAPTKLLSVPPPENVEETFQIGQLVTINIFNNSSFINNSSQKKKKMK